MQIDAPAEHQAASPSPSFPDLDLLVADIAGHLGCELPSPELDGHCELIIDDNRSLSLWPHPGLSGILIMADLPLPEDVDLNSVYGAALGFTLGSASTSAPVIAINENSRLVLAWTLSAQGEPDHAKEGIHYFLESLSQAEAALKGHPVEGAATPPPAAPEEPVSCALVHQEMAAYLGLEKVEFDDAGYCLLQRDDGDLLILQQSAHQRTIALFAQVAAIKEADKDAYAAALEYNYWAALENGAVLGLDMENGGLFLVASLASDDALAAEVEPELERFFRSHADCKGEILDPDHLDDLMEAMAETEDEPQAPAEALPVGSIRV